MIQPSRFNTRQPGLKVSIINLLSRFKSLPEFMLDYLAISDSTKDFDAFRDQVFKQPEICLLLPHRFCYLKDLAFPLNVDLLQICIEQINWELFAALSQCYRADATDNWSDHLNRLMLLCESLQDQIENQGLGFEGNRQEFANNFQELKAQIQLVLLAIKKA